jgi:hypothetical protein
LLYEIIRVFHEAYKERFGKEQLLIVIPQLLSDCVAEMLVKPFDIPRIREPIEGLELGFR